MSKHFRNIKKRRMEEMKRRAEESQVESGKQEPQKNASQIEYEKQLALEDINRGKVSENAEVGNDIGSGVGLEEPKIDFMKIMGRSEDESDKLKRALK